MTLSELNRMVRKAVKGALPYCYWVRAETSGVNFHALSGHCYLEFIENDETGKTIAKARGSIWQTTYAKLRPDFETKTGQKFASGLKVLVNVTVEFHELYGFSLNVNAIDPTYTLGDMQRRRMEIIRRLKENGVFDQNKSLTLSTLPQRIAVITSATAAGYEDFMRQLFDNEYGFQFYTHLFPAVMQGEKTEESIITALDRVAKYDELFDAVVIIRGGGSASELSCFDSEHLAEHCTQFPLPIITGIGHERDDSIVDMVAHTRLKTPTAVAAFLIERMFQTYSELYALQQSICDKVGNTIERARSHLNSITSHLLALPQRLDSQSKNLDTFRVTLQYAVSKSITNNAAAVDELKPRLLHAVDKRLNACKQAVELNEQYIKMVSPEYILRRGYTLTFKDGKIVKRASALAVGDTVSVRFTDGEVNAEINNKNNYNGD